jgi:flagellar basal-body rod modification protein FlgD
MPVDALSAAASNAAGGLRQEDFLKLMLQQLTYQDPLKPMDNQQFIAQMAQFSALAQTQTLNDSMSQLLRVQSTTQAMSLIGRKVTFQQNGQNNNGTVASVTFTPEGGALLSVNVFGITVPGVTMSQISAVAPATTTTTP